MKQSMLIIGTLLLAHVPATCQEFTPRETVSVKEIDQAKFRRAYQWSAVMLAGATASDIGSSLKFTRDGQRESNGLLKSSTGGFGTRGTLLEAGVVGGVLLVQHFIIRRHSQARLPFMLTNFTIVGVQAFNVKHNLNY